MPATKTKAAWAASNERMGDDEKKSAAQPFLSRWSQLKREAREEPPATPPAVGADAPVPDLPHVDELTPESDFTAFMHPKVDVNLRRAALRKLFSDPHFNVMDGLDTYIDDYSKAYPLPPAMLAGLRQAQNILAWARETKEETAARFEPPPAECAVAKSGELTALPAQKTAQPLVNDQTMDVRPASAQPVAEVVRVATDATAEDRKS
jgi:hypothetical protein